MEYRPIQFAAAGLCMADAYDISPRLRNSGIKMRPARKRPVKCSEGNGLRSVRSKDPLYAQ
jgi:hypothetical protein